MPRGRGRAAAPSPSNRRAVAAVGVREGRDAVAIGGGAVHQSFKLCHASAVERNNRLSCRRLWASQSRRCSRPIRAVAAHTVATHRRDGGRRRRCHRACCRRRNRRRRCGRGSGSDVAAAVRWLLLLLLLLRRSVCNSRRKRVVVVKNEVTVARWRRHQIGLPTDSGGSSSSGRRCRWRIVRLHVGVCSVRVDVGTGRGGERGSDMAVGAIVRIRKSKVVALWLDGRAVTSCPSSDGGRGCCRGHCRSHSCCGNLGVLYGRM